MLVFAESSGQFTEWFDYGLPTVLLVVLVALLIRCGRWFGNNFLLPVKDALIGFFAKLGTTQDEITEQQRCQTEQMKVQTGQMELQLTMLQTLQAAIEEHTKSIRRFSDFCKTERS